MTDLATKPPENGNGEEETDLARRVPMPLCLSGRHGEGLLAWVDLRDYWWARRFAWHVNARGYAYCQTGIPVGVDQRGRQELLHRQMAYLHRMVMAARPDQIVDHVDGDKLNCRTANLRFATQAQNNRNVAQRGHSRQPYKGVRRSGPTRWSARIRVDGREIHLGRFADAASAARAYDEAARRMHGAFARTNFPEAGP